MKSLVASAPGKLVVCGEYAVLDGARAISAAVDRRARVEIHDAELFDGPGDVLVTTIGFRDGSYRYRSEASGLTPVADQAALPLLETAWQGARLSAGTKLGLELDTSGFFSSGVKLGLGSSAALTVALVHGLAAWSGRGAKARLTSQATHRRLQGGRGSGIDLATSTGGGLICFRRQAADNSGSVHMTTTSVQQLGWPGELEAAVLFSGVAASTPARLERLGSKRRLAISDVLAEAAEVAARAWQRGVATEVLDATEQFTRVLLDFSDAYGLDIFGGGHSRLAELAQTQGLVYKPCGAGGGDIGIVLGCDAGRVTAFARQSARYGFEWLPVGLGGKTEVEGLTVEWTQD